MNFVKRFLLLVFCAMPCVVGAEPVATTAGNNLTAWNGNSGATNNNNWNTMMNVRTMAGGAAPTADFGNCNSLIMRCAQPKCSGCTSDDIARPIVEGCVNSNASCKQYAADGLVDYITAQIVANANARIQEQQIAAQNAAAQAAAAQNSAQMQQMQAQMMQMQQQMAEQNAAQMAQMQAALDEQKAIAAQAQADALAAQQAQNAAAASTTTVSGGTITEVQRDAAASGVSADLLARQQISGEILTSVDNAELKLKELYTTMQNAFTYAGCDPRGSNCQGPKRVKVFKDKAHQFFQPYDDIVDEMYDALELALAVGVDISDVIMMLNGSCNRWGVYACTTDSDDEYAVYWDGVSSKPTSGKGGYVTCQNGKSVRGGYGRGGYECQNGAQVLPQDDTRCSLVRILDAESDEIMRKWLDDTDSKERLGCATSALDSLAVFGRRSGKKANSTVTLDVLERMLLQDAPEYVGNSRFSSSGNSDIDKFKYCGLNTDGYKNLLTAINAKRLPKNICISDDKSYQEARKARAVNLSSGTGIVEQGYMNGYHKKEDCKIEKIATSSAEKALNCDIKWLEAEGRCISTDCKLVNGELQKITDQEQQKRNENLVYWDNQRAKHVAETGKEMQKQNEKIMAEFAKEAKEIEQELSNIDKIESSQGGGG